MHWAGDIYWCTVVHSTAACRASNIERTALHDQRPHFGRKKADQRELRRQHGRRPVADLAGQRHTQARSQHEEGALKAGHHGGVRRDLRGAYSFYCIMTPSLSSEEQVA